jgi:hypothetical protein
MKKLGKKDFIICLLITIIISLLIYIIFIKNDSVTTSPVLSNYNLANIDSLTLNIDNKTQKIANQEQIKAILLPIDEALTKDIYTIEDNSENYILVNYSDGTNLKITFIKDSVVVIKYPFNNKTFEYVINYPDYLNELKTKFME